MPYRTPALHHGLFLLLRRMRLPLVVLILTYAISVTGLVLIPGVDPAGQPWRMSFFHAFYFVSFMGSTIGFGEIPYPFTDAQRMWTAVSIYISVLAWLYAIGMLLAVLQDPAFRRVVRQASFVANVRRITDPFYLVCGYGDTGGSLVHELSSRHIRAVVLDIDSARIDALAVEDHRVPVPGLTADAADPAALLAAGLTHPRCAGVIALTKSDDINLKVAIASKLLNAALPVICRAETHDTEANMASFGTDHIINPFDAFADRFAMAIHSPSMHVIFEWLTSAHRAPLAEPIAPPRGNWVVCGYGRFGKAVSRFLSFEGIETVIIEADPTKTGAPKNAVIGRGTEAVTLREAHIERAVGIMAGTDNDANNLSIIITARELNPHLFTVGRQNRRRNDAVFEAARLSLVMQPSTIIARKILAIIRTPLLADFLRLARHQDDEWANVLISRILGVAAGNTADTWVFEITQSNAPAAWQTIHEGIPLPLKDLYRDPRDRTQSLSCFALLLKRDEEELLLPPDSLSLRAGDRILFCGDPQASQRMLWTVRNVNVLEYIQTGSERPSGHVWRWLAGDRRGRPRPVP